MPRFFRLFMLLVCVVQAVVAVAFILRIPAVVRLWPLPYTNQMSFLFVASIFLAAAASTFWCIAARQPGALAGVALDYIFIFAPVCIFAFQLAATSRSVAPRNFAVSALLGLMFGIGLFLWSRRIPIPRQPPLPRLVRWSFVAFIIALIVVGSQLVLKAENILPWSVTTSGAIIYGWFFLGAAAYFTYTLLRPSWNNAGGQLAGFLAYDLVLVIPFINLLPTVDPALRLNLYIYLAVVIYSGLLAAYYLFVHPETRVFRARSIALQPA